MTAADGIEPSALRHKAQRHANKLSAIALVKKVRQNGEHRKGQVFIDVAKL